MTQDEMDALDRQVAEEVMGWHLGDGYGHNDAWLDEAGVVQVTRLYFLPSRMWDLAAWLVWKKLPPHWRTLKEIEGTFTIRAADEPSICIASDHTAPLAICYAALEWARQAKVPVA